MADPTTDGSDHPGVGGDVTLAKLFADADAGDINSTQPPSVKFLEWLHRNASTVRDADFHHQIGNAEGNVARGEHTRDGKDSVALFAASDIPADPAATTAALASWAAAINALLRTKSA